MTIKPDMGLSQGISSAVSGVRDLFVAEDAERFFKTSAGRPYQPSNGSEGELFMRLWCSDCQADAAFRADPNRAGGCPIVGDTMCMSVRDPDYPREWQYSERGQPICTAFQPKDTTPAEELPGRPQDKANQ